MSDTENNQKQSDNHLQVKDQNSDDTKINIQKGYCIGKFKSKTSMVMQITTLIASILILVLLAVVVALVLRKPTPELSTEYYNTEGELLLKKKYSSMGEMIKDQTGDKEKELIKQYLGDEEYDGSYFEDDGENDGEYDGEEDNDTRRMLSGSSKVKKVLNGLTKFTNVLSTYGGPLQIFDTGFALFSFFSGNSDHAELVKKLNKIQKSIDNLETNIDNHFRESGYMQKKIYCDVRDEMNELENIVSLASSHGAWSQIDNKCHSSHHCADMMTRIMNQITQDSECNLSKIYQQTHIANSNRAKETLPCSDRYIIARSGQFIKKITAAHIVLKEYERKYSIYPVYSDKEFAKFIKTFIEQVEDTLNYCRQPDNIINELSMKKNTINIRDSAGMVRAMKNSYSSYHIISWTLHTSDYERDGVISEYNLKHREDFIDSQIGGTQYRSYFIMIPNRPSWRTTNRWGNIVWTKEWHDGWGWEGTTVNFSTWFSKKYLSSVYFTRNTNYWGDWYYTKTTIRHAKGMRPAYKFNV